MPRARKARTYQKAVGLKPWWALLRAEHGLITLVAVIVGELLVTGQAVWELVFPALGPLAITWGAFALNDYYGYASDKALKRKDRPLVTGLLKRKEAITTAALLLLLGVVLAWPLNDLAFGIALAYVAGSLLYDPVLKKLPFVGNVFIATTMAVPFLYGSAAVTGTLEFGPLVWALAGVAFFAGLGRELLKTLADVKGDKKLGANTLPMLMGARWTVRLAALFSLVGVGLSLLPLALRFSPSYALLISLSNLAMLASVDMSLESPEEKTLRKCRNYSLVGMGLGVLAFAALALGY